MDVGIHPNAKKHLTEGGDDEQGRKILLRYLIHRKLFMLS